MAILPSRLSRLPSTLVLSPVILPTEYQFKLFQRYNQRKSEEEGTYPSCQPRPTLYLLLQHSVSLGPCRLLPSSFSITHSFNGRLTYTRIIPHYSDRQEEMARLLYLVKQVPVPHDAPCRSSFERVVSSPSMSWPGPNRPVLCLQREGQAPERHVGRQCGVCFCVL